VSWVQSVCSSSSLHLFASRFIYIGSAHFIKSHYRSILRCSHTISQLFSVYPLKLRHRIHFVLLLQYCTVNALIILVAWNTHSEAALALWRCTILSLLMQFYNQLSVTAYLISLFCAQLWKGITKSSRQRSLKILL